MEKERARPPDGIAIAQSCVVGPQRVHGMPLRGVASFPSRSSRSSKLVPNSGWVEFQDLPRRAPADDPVRLLSATLPGNEASCRARHIGHSALPRSTGPASDARLPRPVAGRDEDTSSLGDCLADSPSAPRRPPGGSTRRPAEYWQRAIVERTGGTCFESDYALWALLTALGYEASLHINDMPTATSGLTERCHAAVVVSLEGERYLVDVGLGMRLRHPLRLPHEVGAQTRVSGTTYDQWLRRLSPERLEVVSDGIEGPRQGQLYVLSDQPVTVEEFDDRVVEDYGERGLFLDGLSFSRCFADGSFCLRRANGSIREFERERMARPTPDGRARNSAVLRCAIRRPQGSARADGEQGAVGPARPNRTLPRRIHRCRFIPTRPRAMVRSA